MTPSGTASAHPLRGDEVPQGEVGGSEASHSSDAAVSARTAAAISSIGS